MYLKASYKHLCEGPGVGLKDVNRWAVEVICLEFLREFSHFPRKQPSSFVDTESTFLGAAVSTAGLRDEVRWKCGDLGSRDLWWQQPGGRKRGGEGRVPTGR